MTAEARGVCHRACAASHRSESRRGAFITSAAACAVGSKIKAACSSCKSAQQICGASIKAPNRGQSPAKSAHEVNNQSKVNVCFERRRDQRRASWPAGASTGMLLITNWPAARFAREVSAASGECGRRHQHQPASRQKHQAAKRRKASC